MKFCKKCQCETDRDKQGKCKPCVKLRKAGYQKVSPEKSAASMAKWRKENPERDAENRRSWNKANPELRKIYRQTRRALKSFNGGVLSKGLVGKLLKLQRGLCACCSKPLGDNYNLDHIMPLALGGANEDWNIQLLRETCNKEKHAKHPVDFMRSRGFLI